MAALSAQRLLFLTMSTCMVIVGVLRLTGRITDTEPVVIDCFLTAVILSFSLGRQSRDYL
ncbi:hypothetical protein [Halomarina rubra]|uniref:Uncharacterized protein n=1 Tax=Halomarina rubra TaxID=2071873 RepID=A0ABD6AV70_9EURY|nr:hypothetical protein [Halomarina rubra]